MDAADRSRAVAADFHHGAAKHYAASAGVQLLNHPNWYVQNGNGVNATQYQPAGSTCGDGQSRSQTCYLVPEPGFGTLQTINSMYGPRVLQFSLKWNF